MPRLPVFLGATMILLAAAAALAADINRGQALYEARCGGCHDTSVHGRSPRSAKSFDEVRGYVARWDKQLGTAWTDEEINEVARYLNEKYYQFPCPTAVCKGEQARLPR